MEIQNRSVHIKRTLHAPIELVWEVWSKPEHIAQWWGPSGFTNTIHKMDFQDGGEWNFIMHGPDGKNYPNRSVFKEIVPLEKIVYEHFNPHFITTVLFEANEEETTIDWTVVFDTAEMLQTLIKTHRADEGLKQNLEKLANYLSKQKPM
ncbi:SRPBCC family protein [Muricauda sp. MAR_2010_75]|uniref:SRPBCC family protein n=1 Tax=Allomuricauda sp. MAR_2010_75 TaxID=1250232 RepID=UPI0018CD8E83|nr:SRPBCC family protein [Muricauda sp. MAR_2010_75]